MDGAIEQTRQARAGEMKNAGEQIRKAAWETAESKGKTMHSLRGFAADGTEIYETDDATKKLSYKERMNLFLDYAANDYRGKTARFYKNGHYYYALFEEPDVRKTIYGDKRSDTAGKKALINQGTDGAIFDLVENANYKRGKLETGKQTKAHAGNIAFDYFVKTVQIDGRVFDLVIDVKKKTNGQYIYTLKLNENKQKKAQTLAIPYNAGLKLQEHEASYNHFTALYAKSQEGISARQGAGDAQGDISQQTMYSRRLDVEMMRKASAMNDDHDNGGMVSHAVMDKAGKDRAWIKNRLDEAEYDEAGNRKLLLPEDIAGKGYVGNASYGISAEPTTVCPRSVGFDRLSEMIAKQIGRPLTVDESLAVAQNIGLLTNEIQCLYCYVSADRMAYQDAVNTYFRERDRALAALRSGEITTQKQFEEIIIQGRSTKKSTKSTRAMARLYVNAYKNGDALQAKLDAHYDNADGIRYHVYSTHDPP